jgi:hypothetical protein
LCHTSVVYDRSVRYSSGATVAAAATFPEAPPWTAARRRLMVRCPVCESARVVVVLSSKRRAYCVKCSSKWIQEGKDQRMVQPGVPAAPAVTPPLLAR